MTISNFEDLRMLGFETFSIFFEKVKMLTNEALGIGKPIDETIVVQKILRCLPKRFQVKKAVIQEFQDLNEIKLGKLVRKLITCEVELDMDESDSKKRKEVALQSVENCEGVSDVCRHASEDDFALFIKQFRRILKNKGKDSKWFSESSNNREKQSTGVKHKSYLEARVEELNEKAPNCNDKVEDNDVITTLEAQVQNLLESQENLTNQIHVLKANKVMYHEANKKQLLGLNEANDKVICLTIKVEKTDKMLSIGKLHGDKSGLGFVESGSSSIPTKTKFVRESRLVDRLVIKVNRIAQLVHSSSSGNIKQSSKWVQKDSNKFLVVLNALSATKPNMWYLDNRCSRHMTKGNEALSSLDLFIGSGEDKSQIIGKGDVKILGLPKLENVSYVDGLKSNLISIS
ncbi:uncharacterized protein LOC103926576 [Pyrus x bretschneideri]|uniref:uncharacterized protein LOC103926576 n=1 Tax=Pyrus x bretschneideri TaxID=225117 RepID=UPI00202F92A6|nr:uncharacterized protein LOC103926576 [Pyrus x bretschneideri]